MIAPLREIAVWGVGFTDELFDPSDCLTEHGQEAIAVALEQLRRTGPGLIWPRNRYRRRG